MFTLRKQIVKSFAAYRYQRACLSDSGGSISYSGGQPTNQGGFYASGGSKTAVAAIEHHPGKPMD